MRQTILAVAIGGVVWLLGCEDTFQPVVGYTDRLVVFSIISNQSDIQYVRVNTTYNSTDAEAPTTDHPVLGASVLVTDGVKLYPFRDTVITPWSTSASVASLRAYVASPAQIIPGKTYSLSVTSPTLGTVTATTVVPGPATVTSTDELLLREPFLYDQEDLTILSQISRQAQGFVVRLYLEYEVAVVNAGWKAVRMEIPRWILSYNTIEDFQATYPTVIKRQTPIGSAQPERVVFSQNLYRFLIKALRSKYKPGEIQFHTLKIELYQYEENLFNYYNVASGFRDQFSLRSDLPDLSNIKGGAGIFGAYTWTVKVIQLPDNIGL